MDFVTPVIDTERLQVAGNMSPEEFARADADLRAENPQLQGQALRHQINQEASGMGSRVVGKTANFIRNNPGKVIGGSLIAGGTALAAGALLNAHLRKKAEEEAIEEQLMQQGL